MKIGAVARIAVVGMLVGGFGIFQGSAFAHSTQNGLTKGRGDLSVDCYNNYTHCLENPDGMDCGANLAYCLKHNQPGQQVIAKEI